jgi:DNA-binding NtrC family response regulator
MTTASVQVILVQDDVAVNNVLRDWLQQRWKTSSLLDFESALRERLPSNERTILIIDSKLPVYNCPVLPGQTLPLARTRPENRGSKPRWA